MHRACDRREERVCGSFTGRRFLRARLLCRGVFLRHVCRRSFFRGFFRRLCSGCRFRLYIGRCFEVRLKIRLDDGDLRAIDDLHARSLDDDADGARRLQELLVDERGIRDRAAKARRAAVDGSDVPLAAKAARDCRALGIGCARAGRCSRRALLRLVVSLRIELRLLVVVLAARRLEVEVTDHPREDEVVEEEVDDTDRDDVHPARLRLSLQDAEDEEVEETARECQADGDVEDVRDHVGGACERDLHGEERGCDEEEGELDRLGDAREHRGQSRREQEAARDLLLLGTRTAVHSERRARQAEDHEDELAREVARRIRAEMRDIGRSELGEEDVLTALDELAVDHHRAADARLPERQIEDVVQAKGDQSALDDAEDQRADVARARHEAAEREDALLGERPDEVHGDADEEEDDRRDDGHEA